MHTEKYKRPKQRYSSNCSARILPYFYNTDGEICLIMVNVQGYGDWTAMGGKCKEIMGRCPEEMNQSLLTCLYRELEEESHFAITKDDIDLCSSGHMFFNYIDKHQRENNIRFAMLKEDRDILHTLDAFYDPRVLQEIKKLPNGADYLETTNMTYLPLYGDFLRYAKNAYNKKSRKNERIDFSILDGLYSIFQVNDPLQLVEKIQSHLKQCDRKI